VKTRDLLIMHDYLESSTELTEMLRILGFATRYVSMSSGSTPKNLYKPIICVTLEKEGGSVALVQKRVTDLVQLKHLTAYPLIVIGPEAKQYSAMIRHFVRNSVVINTPYTEDDLLAGIAEIDHVVGSEEEKKGQKKLFDIFADENLYEKVLDLNLGGKEYMFASDANQIADKSYLPSDTMVLEITQDITKRMSKWSAGHIHRTAFVTNNILRSLNIDSETQEKAKMAAMLFAWAIEQGSEELTRVDYSSANADEMRDKLSAKVEESAEKITAELGEPVVGEIVQTLAKLITGNTIDEMDDVTRAAAAIFAADLMDRACWQSGTWNPASAHRILNKCKNGEIEGIPPDIIVCLLKIMLEAVEATAPKRMLPRSVANNAALVEMAKNHHKAKINDNERRIPISHLKPGMKLTRPLVAYDGKTIIPENVVLDTDIIWRIWSLSAVRALNSPLVIQVEETTSSPSI
jgi:hypothetical protein